MKQSIRNNSLSLVFCFLFVCSILGQSISGFHEYNKDREENGQPKVAMHIYLESGHFIQATFENWESEFLQMALFVLFTIFLRQKGSSESKKIDEVEPVDAEPSASRKRAPWPVKKGGLILALYKHSLSLAFFLLFSCSLLMHFTGACGTRTRNCVPNICLCKRHGNISPVHAFGLNRFKTGKANSCQFFVL